MNKNESKYYNTALLMDEALIELLNKKEIEYITVKEIVEKAGVNRSTFYLHYESISDLVDETISYIDKKFIKYFNEEKIDIDSSTNEALMFIQDKYLIPYLKFIKEHKMYLKQMLIIQKE